MDRQAGILGDMNMVHPVHTNSWWSALCCVTMLFIGFQRNYFNESGPQGILCRLFKCMT